MHSGRCYCGATTIVAHTDPLTIAYCHCTSCRRQSGAPVAAFAAFEDGALAVLPKEGPTAPGGPGAYRRFCPTCGSATTARYDYLPGQIYVPIGLFDDPDAFAPKMHSHVDEAVTWLHISDDLPRETGSGRDRLNDATL